MPGKFSVNDRKALFILTNLWTAGEGKKGKENENDVNEMKPNTCNNDLLLPEWEIKVKKKKDFFFFFGGWRWIGFSTILTMKTKDMKYNKCVLKAQRVKPCVSSQNVFLLPYRSIYTTTQRIHILPMALIKLLPSYIFFFFFFWKCLHF